MHLPPWLMQILGSQKTLLQSFSRKFLRRRRPPFTMFKLLEGAMELDIFVQKSSFIITGMVKQQWEEPFLE
jgi:hypothetical protein